MTTAWLVVMSHRRSVYVCFGNREVRVMTECDDGEKLETHSQNFEDAEHVMKWADILHMLHILHSGQLQCTSKWPVTNDYCCCVASIPFIAGSCTLTWPAISATESWATRTTAASSSTLASRCAVLSCNASMAAPVLCQARMPPSASPAKEPSF